MRGFRRRTSVEEALAVLAARTGALGAERVALGEAAGRVLAIRRPTVRVLVTGDELLPPGSVPTGACIVDANSPMLAALVARDGAAAPPVVVYVPDRREAVRAALAGATEDVVLISGGSS